jgi:hypothetical protein
MESESEMMELIDYIIGNARITVGGYLEKEKS